MKPKRPSNLALRWTGVALGIASVIWLPWEDTNLTLLLLLAAGWCAWAALRFYQRSTRGWSQGRLLLLGAAAGLGVSPGALCLAALKAGLHAHGFSDFTTRQLTILIFSTPGWIGLGLAAAGVLVLLRAAKPPTEE